MRRVRVAVGVLAIALVACGRSGLVDDLNAGAQNSAFPATGIGAAGNGAIATAAAGRGGLVMASGPVTGVGPAMPPMSMQPPIPTMPPPLPSRDAGVPMVRDAGPGPAFIDGGRPSFADAGVAALCIDKEAYVAVCDGLVRKRCSGSQLVAFDCQANAHCDASGGVKCVCNNGYADDGQGGCSVNDRCAGGPCGPAPNVCTPNSVAFSCTCGAGYTGSGGTYCTDLNECTLNNGGCDPRVSCTNTPGSRTCGPCPPHYAGDGESGCVQHWTQQIGSTGQDVPGAVAVDANGQIVIAGYTDSDFDGHRSAGNDDMLAVSFDRSGQKLWSTLIGTSDVDVAVGIAIAPNGDRVLAGYSDGSFDGNTNVGVSDAIVVRYDATGQKLWSRQLGTTDEDIFESVATDASGSVFAVGYTRGGVDANANAGAGDVLLVKFDAAGTKQWSVQFGSANFDAALGVATDPAGNVYLVGSTSGGLDGATNAGNNDVFVAKYDSDGHKQWLDQLGGSGTDSGLGIAVDAQGNVYIAGSTDTALGANTSLSMAEVFLVKLDTGGAKQWTQTLGDAAMDLHGTQVVLDAGGNIYVAGYEMVYRASADYDFLLAKFDATGQKQWERVFGSASEDVSTGIAIDGKGNIYVAGYTMAPFDGDAWSGGQDIVIVKFDSAGNEL